MPTLRRGGGNSRRRGTHRRREEANLRPTPCGESFRGESFRGAIFCAGFLNARSSAQARCRQECGNVVSADKRTIGDERKPD